VYELMCTFFFSCHTHTLASEPGLGQPDWRKNRGQFSQKKVWLRVRVNGGFVEGYGGLRRGERYFK
jgi:hypothetical protein